MLVEYQPPEGLFNIQYNRTDKHTQTKTQERSWFFFFPKVACVWLLLWVYVKEDKMGASTGKEEAEKKKRKMEECWEFRNGWKTPRYTSWLTQSSQPAGLLVHQWRTVFLGGSPTHTPPNLTYCTGAPGSQKKKKKLVREEFSFSLTSWDDQKSKKLLFTLRLLVTFSFLFFYFYCQ